MKYFISFLVIFIAFRSTANEKSNSFIVPETAKALQTLFDMDFEDLNNFFNQDDPKVIHSSRFDNADNPEDLMPAGRRVAWITKGAYVTPGKQRESGIDVCEELKQSMLGALFSKKKFRLNFIKYDQVVIENGSFKSGNIVKTIEKVFSKKDFHQHSDDYYNAITACSSYVPGWDHDEDIAKIKKYFENLASQPSSSEDTAQVRSPNSNSKSTITKKVKRVTDQQKK